MAELGGSDPPVRGDDPASERDAALVRALRAGDERAFAELVDAFGPQMLRVARGFTPSRSVAEEVVQEAWLAVLQGLDRFEGRSSLKTWIFRILTNRAITRGTREHRSVPFSSLGPAEEPDQPAVDPTRFQGPRSRHPGDWASPPSRWDLPDERMVGRETLLVIKDAIDRLTPSQRTVITLRDVEGWSSKDVCNVLDITETNQRVLLHRARSSVRAALERYLDPVERDNAGGPGR